MTDLFESIARQIMRDRTKDSPFGGSRGSHALLLAAGYDASAAFTDLNHVTMPLGTFTYLEAVLYGLVPPRLRRPEAFPIALHNPYVDNRDYSLSDPLQLAGFFAAKGMRDEANEMLEDREEHVFSYSQAMSSPESWAASVARSAAPRKPRWMKSYFDSAKPRHYTKTWLTPAFEELGLKPVERCVFGLDTIYTCGGQSKESFLANMKRSINKDNVQVFSMISGRLGNRLHSELEQIAYVQAVEQGLKTSVAAYSYDGLARFLQLCTKKEADDVMDNLQGTRRAACIARHDANPDQYLQGLRAITGLADEQRKAALKYMARAPSIEEIRQVRTSTIVNVLDEMPWELLEPLTKKEGIRAVALPHAERLGPVLLGRFLTNHKDRVSRIPDVRREASYLAERDVIAGSNMASGWSDVMDRLGGFYSASRRIREQLHLITDSAYISALVLLDSFGASTPEIEQILEHYPHIKKARKVLLGWEMPEPKMLWL